MSKVQKLTRLLAAQQVMENQAQSLMSNLSLRKVELERRIAAAGETVEKSEIAMLFSDLHLGHQLKLIDEKTILEVEFQSALQKLQIEKMKSKRLGERLKQARYQQQRRIEEDLIFEQLDRTLVGQS